MSALRAAVLRSNHALTAKYKVKTNATANKATNTARMVPVNDTVSSVTRNDTALPRAKEKNAKLTELLTEARLSSSGSVMLYI